MKTMNKVLAVSILAITAVSAANAKIVSESLLTSTPGTYTSTNTVQAAIADAKKAGTDAAALASGKVSSVGTGSANGTISVNGSDVAVKGLKSAAYTESSAYATAAQGALAETALQSHQNISGKQDVSNIVGDPTGADYTTYKTSTTKYPSMAAANAMAEAVQNNLGGQVAGKQDILLSGATGANVIVDGTGNVITAVDAPGDGSITFTKGATLATVATSGSYNDLSNKPTIGNATLTIKRNGTAVDTFTANATSDKSINITDNDHITTATTSGSGNVVTAISADANGALTVTKGITALTSHQDISGKQNIQIGATTDSGKAVVVDADGKIAMSSATLKTVATSGSYSDLSNKPTIGNATLTIKRNGTAVDTFTANATSDKSINITDSDHITTATTSGSGNVVTAISADANGALTVTKGITALTSHQNISGKQDVSNMVTATTGTDYTSNKTSTTKYPSMATANAMAEAVQNNLGGQVAGKQDILLSGVAGANVTFTGSGNVLTSVDAPGDGTIEFSLGRVQIPSGSETASSYASIWVE